jgi:quinol monooxygenase YgiN
MSSPQEESMYGTVARIKVKPELLDQAMEFMQTSGDLGTPPGGVAFYLYQLDANPNDFYMVVVFEDKEKYFANANDPRTDAQFQEMARFLAEEPKWHDGEIVYSQLNA